MEKARKSLRETFEYNTTANDYIARDPKNKNTHLAVAINKVSASITKGMKPYNKMVKKWNKKMDDLRVDYAHTDSDGVIQFEMVDGGNGQKTREYKYKKDKYKELGNKIIELEEKRDEEIEKFLDEEYIEFHPKYSVHIPSNLTEWEKEIFSGIIIDPKVLALDSAKSNGTIEKTAVEVTEA